MSENNSGEELIQQRRSKKRKFEEISNEESSEVTISANQSVIIIHQLLNKTLNRTKRRSRSIQ